LTQLSKQTNYSKAAKNTVNILKLNLFIADIFRSSGHRFFHRK